MSHPVDETAARPERGRAGPFKTAFVSVLIVLAGIALIWLIFKTEPTATRKDASRETAMLVDVQTVERGEYRPTIEVMGRVMPAREVTLSARVSGQVIEQAESFTPGRHVSEGEPLLRIDPADYEVALEQRRSELQQALADLELEKGQQAVARQEFELLGESIPADNEALILREPQLKQAQAAVASARAAVRQAELDLARTRIRAPFPAQVLSREVTRGSQVSTGESLGRLVATDRYWVEATVPMARLQWLQFDTTPGESGAQVSLRQDNAWPAGETRIGRLGQMVGELEDSTRMARVLITVDDPLALAAAKDKPPLILGSFLSAEIQARPLSDVVRLERNLVRRENTVWVMEDRKLAIREVGIAFEDETYAYIDSGLEDGDQVITNNLSSVVKGARLRLEGDSQ
ncbi:RND family efflux transporter, MFP subunit [Marinobacter persicus]|uniref:RND family efflux transporter, MFP subunit n=1 Tax=Marinobacter persicus TaxID=930118 RepID=A0A1I3WSP8_9GAMM|nr:efflux RND transporter periplasmic adaptor subunit [Marinobacter persicus]GHD47953.1 hemolysin D [Marinobacter persicus]SFK09867.1 RND family efflux transporter, MFP subunit [Marinobacter persicus]